MHELEETSRSAVSMLDVLRSEGREPSDEEADFFGTMMGRIQALATGHQSGSYSSSAFLLAKRSPKRSNAVQAKEDAARRALTHEIENLLRGAEIDRSRLYDDGLRQRCEQMGAPHLGVLQRMRDGTPAHDLLADRAVDRVVLRETLEALRAVSALRMVRENEPPVAHELEFDIESTGSKPRFSVPQWVVIAGVFVGLIIVVAGASHSYVAPPEPTTTEASQDPVVADPVTVTLAPVSVVEPPALADDVGEVAAKAAAESPESVEAEAEAETPEPEAKEPLPPKHGELLVMPGSRTDVRVKVRGKDYGPPPVRLRLREGLHTVVFESQGETYYRFWHVHEKQRRQVSAP